MESDTDELPLNLARRLMLAWFRQRNRMVVESDGGCDDILSFLEIVRDPDAGSAMVAVDQIQRQLLRFPAETCPVEKRFFGNLETIRCMLGLDETEVMILALLCVKATVHQFAKLCRILGVERLRHLVDFVAACLDRSPREIGRLLSHYSRLRQAGLFGHSVLAGSVETISCDR